LCLAKEPKERPSVNELLNHNLFQKINSNAFEEIAGCVDTWDDWSWDENKSFEKAIESSSSSHEEEDIKLDHPKQPRRSSSFQVDDKKIKKIKRKSQKNHNNDRLVESEPRSSSPSKKTKSARNEEKIEDNKKSCDDIF